MNMQQKLVDIVAEYKDVDASEIDTEASFRELGLDSLDVAELSLKIEEELGIILELSPKYNSIEKLAAYLEKKAE